jgi:hypothetical protein
MGSVSIFTTKIILESQFLNPGGLFLKKHFKNDLRTKMEGLRTEMACVSKMACAQKLNS